VVKWIGTTKRKDVLIMDEQVPESGCLQVWLSTGNIDGEILTLTVVVLDRNFERGNLELMATGLMFDGDPILTSSSYLLFSVVNITGRSAVIDCVALDTTLAAPLQVRCFDFDFHSFLLPVST
jgi:hypothetical protein